MMRPGMTVSDADSIVRNIISDNEVGARLVTRSGYSIGIAFPPSWDEGYILSLNPGDFTVLEEGMTFHVIPWMWGVDGDKTVGISDTIRITDDGCESFFDLPEDFTVVGRPCVDTPVADHPVRPSPSRRRSSRSARPIDRCLTHRSRRSCEEVASLDAAGTADVIDRAAATHSTTGDAARSRSAATCSAPSPTACATRWTRSLPS